MRITGLVLILVLLSACAPRFEPATASIESVEYMLAVGSLESSRGPRHPLTMKVAIRGHIEFIIGHSDLQYAERWGLPRIEFWPRERIRDSHPDRPNEVYQVAEQTIILPDNYGHWIDVDGILVHAVAHWLQARNRVLNPWPCRNRDELLAYSLQAGWVAAMRGEAILLEHAAEVKARVEAIASCKT